MKDIQGIFYDDVANVVFDTYGKTYPISKAGGWKHINKDGDKIGISKIPRRMKIFDFDDFSFHYVFGNLRRDYPCIAMEYFVYRKMSEKNISRKEFLNHINKK